MTKLAFLALPLAALASIAPAQDAREITFFSNTTLSGGQFTVTGPRTNLDLPFVARSAALRGGGKWEICSGQNYSGKCEVIEADTRNLTFGTIRSIRLVQATAVVPAPWVEVARLTVRDRNDRETAIAKDRRTEFRQVKICAESQTVRIRRAEIRLEKGTWQRLFVPLALSQGECSDAIDLLGQPKRVRAVRFEFEAWSPGIERGTLSVHALPAVTPQPR